MSGDSRGFCATMGEIAGAVRVAYGYPYDLFGMPEYPLA